MNRKFCARSLTVAGVAAGSLLLPAFAMAAPGGTGHTVTETDHQHGTFVDDEAVNPCTGEAGVVTFDGNSVEHVTFFPGGDEVWGTFTETGQITAVFGDVTYTGHATTWGNFNVNEQNDNSTFTLTVHATGSDGSTIIGHETIHIGTNANGDITASFDKVNFTCQ